MGIFDALTTAVGGMRAQAYALQNVSGNIANSQTIGFKRIDTSFMDLIPRAGLKNQLAGNVVAMSRATNTVQGDIQSSSIGTFMAVNGSGFFVVQKPSNFIDNRPNFGGVDMYTRRGDFQLDQNGYLVNGAGYYLSGIPVDSKSGNLVGSAPQTLQFKNGFIPAVATSEIEYHVNLASYPLTADHDTNVPGSELINPANFTANPINGAPGNAKITGKGATLKPDAAAVLKGTTSISSLTSAAGGTITINGTNIAIAAGDDATAIQTKINAQSGTTKVSASLDGSGKLVLTSSDAKTNIAIGNGSTLALLNEIGVSVGTTYATNLVTQGAVSAGQTMTVGVGGNATLTMTFGTGNIMTMADMNTALGTLAGGTASIDSSNGNLTVTAGNTTDTITIGGSAAAKNFGVRTLTGMPANGTVLANDNTSFLNETIGGGAVTVYDQSGAAVNVQLRWGKVDSASLGSGHTDKWNLFYQSNSKAKGTEAQWQNVGVDYTFGANGQLDPAINSTTLTNLTVDGVSIGDIKLTHGSAGVTQFSDPNGNAQVNQLTQNGYAAGSLQGISVSDKGRIVGSYSNGRTLDLAQVTLANFSGANNLARTDGGAFEQTAESGSPTYNASGNVVGSSLEGSNTDIADEFTKLIVTQQAYSANTRVITTSNQMVQDLLNMLR
jgi:flagellar hook protein FlgE